MANVKRNDAIEMMTESDAIGLLNDFEQLIKNLKNGWVGYENMSNEELEIEYNDMFNKTDTIID